MIYDPTPRWKKILDALSQLGNVSNPFWDHTQTTSNESISGRSYRMGWGLARWIDWLFTFIEDEHTRKSYESDVERARSVIAEHEGR
jgi:hypothetical protein